MRKASFIGLERRQFNASNAIRLDQIGIKMYAYHKKREKTHVYQNISGSECYLNFQKSFLALKVKNLNKLKYNIRLTSRKNEAVKDFVIPDIYLSSKAINKMSLIQT